MMICAFGEVGGRQAAVGGKKNMQRWVTWLHPIRENHLPIAVPRPERICYTLSHGSFDGGEWSSHLVSVCMASSHARLV